jgi:y4mF family transcriptional regulator
MLLRRPHDLGALIRDARGAAGWSQSDLADRVGVSRQWVSLVERGKTSVEFDLVVSTLQVLGFELRLDTVGATDRQPPSHEPSERTTLTRHGRPLGRRGVRRSPNRTGRTYGGRG